MWERERVRGGDNPSSGPLLQGLLESSADSGADLLSSLKEECIETSLAFKTNKAARGEREGGRCGFSSSGSEQCWA